MANSTWPSHKTTGIDVIDNQHQALIDLVNAFCSNPAERGDTVRVAAFISALVAETEAHFLAEERIMADCRYPRLGVHRVAHARLLTQISDVARRAELGENLNFDGFLDFLKVWLIDHIDYEDSLLAEHLHDGEKSPEARPEPGAVRSR